MKSLMTACGVVALLSGAPAFAQSTTATTTTTAPSPSSSAGAVDPAIARMSADQLKNKEVYGSDGKELAKIEGVVRKGNDTFAVLDVDHVVNISDKDVVLPMNKLHMTGDKLAVDMTKEQMQGLEKWQKGQYEDIKGALK
ncbi:PRC-barrel domain-containing protein [Azospirillum canadense]|uniref:PRC-barrel domain-containing protein n=1 Tax=Azospirillum canadense TaxID=403962 RepID=UPI002227F690|nr:PRC-barrel domain-containing protein [Azospirillum canadense]MCW2239300.1 sporulation protein YlmC with PRC-barrel domain [Azospirillum canadense]